MPGKGSPHRSISLLAPAPAPTSPAESSSSTSCPLHSSLRPNKRPPLSTSYPYTLYHSPSPSAHIIAPKPPSPLPFTLSVRSSALIPPAPLTSQQHSSTPSPLLTLAKRDSSKPSKKSQKSTIRLGADTQQMALVRATRRQVKVASFPHTDSSSQNHTNSKNGTCKGHQISL